MIPVALRSEDPALIETVRSVLAVSSIPLAVFPESVVEPVEIGLALDGGTESTGWRSNSRRYAKVGLRSGEDLGADVLILPHAAEEILSLARAANRVLRARVVGVVGAAGGVGASSFAAALARAGAEAGLQVALAEGAGNPALSVLLDATYSPGLRWADLAGSGLDVGDVSDSLPRWHGTRLLLGDDRPSPGMTAGEPVITGLAHTHDLVVMDLQRSDVAAGVTKRWCDAVLVLTTPGLPALSAARALCATLSTESVHLVVRGPIRAGVPRGEIPAMVRAEVLTYMRAERSLEASVERGLTPGDHRRGPLLRAARETLQALAVI